MEPKPRPKAGAAKPPPCPPARSPRRRRALRLVWVGSALLCSIAFVHMFIRFPTHLFGGDWLQMQFYWEAPRQEILRWGQIPLWNPFYCGGNILMGHPHSQFVTPFFLVALPLGTSVAFRFALLGHLLLGIWGMAVLGRDLGLRGPGRVLMAFAFPLTGFFAWHIVGGHFWALGFHLLPWLYLCYLRALGPRGEDAHRRRWPWLFVGAVFLAWMVFHSGIYSVPFAALALGLDALLRTAGAERGTPLRERMHPLGAALAIGLLGFLLAGPKSFPLVAYLSEHQRVFKVADDPLRLHDLARMFFGRIDRWQWDQGGGRFLYRWWGEYANDIAYTILPLALIGLVGAWRRTRRFALLSLLFLILMLGDHGPYSPYALLRRLPVFKGLHVPSRYTIMVTFFLVPVAAVGLDRLLLWVRKGWSRRAAAAVATIVLAFTIGEPLIHHLRVDALNQHFEDKPVAPEPSFFQHSGSSMWMCHYARMGQGTLMCYEESQLDHAKDLRAGRVPQVWPAVPGSANARMTSWSPNAIEIEVDAFAPATLAVNQNFDAGWQVEGEAERTRYGGLLALRVQTGLGQRIRLRYLPTSFVLGSMSAAAVLALWAALSLWETRRRRAPRAPGRSPRG